MEPVKAYDLWSAEYDTMRNRTRDLDERATEEMLRDKYVHTILELGCGTGKNTMKFADHATRVIALDFSEGMLQVAREKIKEPHVSFFQADITKPWLLPVKQANLICCNLVLEHIEDIDFVFAQAAGLLTAGGEFFISELHPYKQYTGAKANFETRDGKIEVTCFVHHLSSFWDAAATHGFGCVSVREWFVEEEGREVPRLINFMFRKL